jgi:hypothetical protein
MSQFYVFRHLIQRGPHGTAIYTKSEKKKKKGGGGNRKQLRYLGQLNLPFVCGLVGSSHVRRLNGRRVAVIVVKSLFTVPSHQQTASINLPSQYRGQTQSDRSRVQLAFDWPRSTHSKPPISTHPNYVMSQGTNIIS